MTGKNGSENSADQDGRGWEEGNSLDGELVATGVVSGDSDSDSDPEVTVASDEDLDELDVPFDPEFSEAMTWGVDDLELELDVIDEDEMDEETLEDEAEILLLHELGIDLDAPDAEPAIEIQFTLDTEEMAEEGVAA